MNIPSEPFFFESGIHGPAPVMWYGPDRPDGDASPFAEAPVGATYYRTNATGLAQVYLKRKNDGADNDWSLIGPGVISETVSYADFTDGGAAVGTFDLSENIPSGAFVYRSVLVDVTGFAGDTSATIQVGDGTDVDRYSTGTPSVFTTANAIDLGAVSGTAIHTAAKTPKLTVTSNSDWGSVTAGQLTIRIYYFA